MSFKSMHGILKTIEGPPNLGINLPLSSKPTNSMSPNNNNNKEGVSINSLEKGERKPTSPTKKSSNGTDLPKKVPLSTSCPGWTCRECDRLFTQREVFIAHMKREHGKVKSSCFSSNRCFKFLSVMSKTQGCRTYYYYYYYCRCVGMTIMNAFLSATPATEKASVSTV